MKLLTTLLTLTLLTIGSETFSQNSWNATWSDIDTSIRQQKKWVELENRLDSLKREAISKKQDIDIGRAMYYTMRLKDRKYEDSLYFINSTFADSIIKDNNSNSLLKSIMLVIKAQRLYEYQHRSFKTNRRFFPAGKEYTALSPSQLDSLSENLLVSAQVLSTNINIETIEQLLWLSSDRFAFLYKPDLSDIIFLERILIAQTKVNIPNEGENSWLLLSPADFIAKDTLLFSECGERVFEIYKEWMHYHQQQPETYYFIEMQARKYFYSKIDNTETDTEKYETYLQGRLNTNFSAVKANAIYQLCLIWNKKGDQYGLEPSTGNPAVNQRKTSYRMYYSKAVELYNNNVQLLDSFLMLKTFLSEMKQKIETPNVKIQIKDVQIPYKQVEAYVSFKNVKKLYTRLISLGIQDIASKDHSYNLSRYTIMPYINDTVIPLPDSADFQWHRALLNIGLLEAGKYAFLFSDSPIATSTGKSNYIILNITKIAILQSDDRYFLLDRNTGFPLKNAKLIISRKVDNKMLYVTRNAGVNGEVLFSEKCDSLMAICNADSIKISSTDLSIQYDDRIYNEDEYFDLAQYYEDNTNIEIFTDRAIYRPGQKVYFKGIMLTNDPRTGKKIILNKTNLQFPFFQKLALRFKKTKLDILLTDAFNENADSLKVFPNEFGSFSGEFLIPKNAPTGWWEIENDKFEIGYHNRASFRVEEYKKPTFVVIIEKPTKHLALGDTVPVTIKVKSFAGAELQQIKVRYTVNASGYIPYKNPGSSGRINYRNEIIQDSILETDERGRASFYITDKYPGFLNLENKKKVNIQYGINAEAIDAEGETIEENISVYLSNRPVFISTTIPKIIDRKDLGRLNISTRSDYGGNIERDIVARVYRIDKYTGRQQPFQKSVDAWLYPADSINNWFGEMQTSESENERKLIYTQSIRTGRGETVLLPRELMPAGHYIIELTAEEKEILTGEMSYSIDVFDSETKEIPDQAGPFYFLPVNRLKAGDEMILWTGATAKKTYSIYQLSYFVKQGRGIKLNHQYEYRDHSPGLNYWKIRLPENAIGDIELQQVSLYNNQEYTNRETIYATEDHSSPEIIVEQYRKILVPGEKQEFVVSVKTDDHNTAAELMTVMYDASLDKIESKEWNIPNNAAIMPRALWNNMLWSNTEQELRQQAYSNEIYYFYSSVWWKKEKEAIWAGYDGVFNDGLSLSEQYLSGRAAGVSILQAEGLNEVVVVGYGISHKSLGYSTAIVMRGTASLTGNSNALIVVDGVVYNGSLSSISGLMVTDILVLKGADAVSIYGSRAAAGVLMISTNGKVAIPAVQVDEHQSTPVVVRQNFNDIAFFHPAIYADKKGQYNIRFTMPDNLTEWKWKMLAHTKSAQFAYTDRLVNSQLKLMVEPAMPKFLYQGDKIKLKTRITNLDSTKISGVFSCFIEDAVSGSEITPQIIATSNKTISLDANANSSAEFELKIPEGQLHPLKIRITFVGSTASDGEEHTIPVLSKRQLLSENIQLDIPKAGLVNIKVPVLPVDAIPYGMEIFIQPKAQASMINALPYLADYPWNCAEQIFNKLFARIIALHLMRTDTSISTGWHIRTVGPGTEVHDALNRELAESAMPWLTLNNFSEKNKQDLQELFDTSSSLPKIDILMTELSMMQRADGGMPWFKGGESDPYISAYILTGLGKMNTGLNSEFSTKTRSMASGMVQRLVHYVDSLLSIDRVVANFPRIISGRSYWINEYPMDQRLKTKADSTIRNELDKSYSYSLDARSRLVIAAFQMDSSKSDLYKNAMEKLESIRQMAINDKVNGMRWKEISSNDDLNQSDEETLVSIAEAFTAGNQAKDIINSIIQWLMVNKRDHYWSNTKATADVVGLLAKSKENISGTNKTLVLDQMVVSDQFFSGIPAAFTRFKNNTLPPVFQVRASSDSSSGNIKIFYFSEGPASQTNKNLSIAKTMYLLDRYSDQWKMINDSTVLKTGDKVKCNISISSPNLLQYVHIEDHKPATFDNLDGESGYRYEERLSYYVSVRETSMQFFMEKIPSGITNFSYDMIVSKEGVFSYGPVSLTCLYNPANAAVGRPGVVQVKD